MHGVWVWCLEANDVGACCVGVVYGSGIMCVLVWYMEAVLCVCWCGIWKRYYVYVCVGVVEDR